MAQRLVTDAQLIEQWKKTPRPTACANALGISARRVMDRRATLVSKGHVLDTVSQDGRSSPYGHRMKFERVRNFDVRDGHVVVFSDPHFYPDHTETAMDALLEVIKEFKPLAVVCGGDALDSTQLSHFDPTRGWHKPPSVREQVECMADCMDRIKRAAGKGAITAMTLGNHDARFSRYLAVRAPEWEDMPGTRLEDFIPAWPLSWAIMLNDSTVIRHRNQAGMLHLQGQKAGVHYIHGHLHRLNVHALAQYNKFTFSVDCGSFADPNSDAFDYAEGGPPHVQGFAVLTYRKRELMWPELCYIQKGNAYFRGKPI